MSESKSKSWVDYVTIFIAISALGFSLYQFDQTVTRQENQTELEKKLEIEKVKPVLQITFRKADSEQERGFVVSNVGGGPALITSFKYYLDSLGFVKKDNLKSWLNEYGYPFVTADTKDFSDWTILVEGHHIPPGKDNEIFLFKNNRKKFYNSQARKDLENVIVEIEYKSLTSLDDSTYYLLYCEKFEKNNQRDKNIYLKFE